MISPPDDERMTVQSEGHENSYALLGTSIAIVVVIALVLGSLALSADMMTPDSPAEHQYIPPYWG
jgi:hypothetical protein